MFASYLEMICKKYSSRYPNFEIVIPDWIHEDINDNSQFNRIKKIISKYYANWNILYSDGENVPLVDDKNKPYFQMMFFHNLENYLFI